MCVDLFRISENLGMGLGTVTTMICIVATLPLIFSVKVETEPSSLGNKLHRRPYPYRDSKSKRITLKKKKRDKLDSLIHFTKCC